MSSLKLLEMMVPGTKRTLSAVLTALPRFGVGSRVAKDTWLALGNSYYEITRVVAHKDAPHLVDVWALKTFNGKTLSDRPQRISAVWRWGWTWLPKQEEKARLEAFLQANPQLAPVPAPVPNPVQEAAYALRWNQLPKEERPSKKERLKLSKRPKAFKTRGYYGYKK